MNTSQENAFDRQLSHREAVRRHAARLKATGTPRLEDTHRAIGHALRDYLAHFVNIGPKASKEERAVVQAILLDARKKLIARGFDPQKTSELIIRAIRPIMPFEAAQDDDCHAPRSVDDADIRL